MPYRILEVYFLIYVSDILIENHFIISQFLFPFQITNLEIYISVNIFICKESDAILSIRYITYDFFLSFCHTWSIFRLFLLQIFIISFRPNSWDTAWYKLVAVMIYYKNVCKTSLYIKPVWYCMLFLLICSYLTILLLRHFTVWP